VYRPVHDPTHCDGLDHFVMDCIILKHVMLTVLVLCLTSVTG
jgi:hypothetical protein